MEELDKMNLFDKSAVIIVTYNCNDNLTKTCLELLKANKGLEIIVVDNNSCDGTPEFIEENFPFVKLIKNKNNNGFGAGVNLGINETKREYVVVLNPDTKVMDNTIIELLKPLKNQDKLITTPKILRYDGSKISACGNVEHFTGLAFSKGLGAESDAFNEFEFVNGLSGGCFAMKRNNYIDLGGFNEKFFLYMEDAELSWKANVNGYKILYVPSSVVYHNHILKVDPKKIYYLEKGRYMVLRIFLTDKDYLIFLPSLIITEILTWGYSILSGYDGIKFKFKGLKEGITVNITKIDSNKKELFKSLDFRIPEDQLDYGLLSKVLKRFANWIYGVNYIIYIMLLY